MKTWNNTDKTGWPQGEWNDEPDKAHWIDDKTGLDCLIVRGPSGALCGYVGVPESSQYFEMGYDAVYEVKDVDVHGGLTFADRCHPNNDELKGICHPKEGSANETVWWLGFDCAHCDDLAPKHHSEDYYRPYSVYRNFNYVKREVTNLASQLAA